MRPVKPRAQAGHVSLHERARCRWYPAVWRRGRGHGKGQPRSGSSDKDGKLYILRYEAVNAMLLNEFLKEHRKNEEQQAIIGRQQKQIDALTAGLQKLSARLELKKSAPQTVATGR